jgi:hypothetical protein
LKNIKAWFGKHRKALGYILLLVVVSAMVGVAAYNAGQRSKKATPASTFSLDKLKEAAKKAEQTRPAPGSILKNSSGAFRFYGTITKQAGESITITLSNKSTVTLVATDKTMYYDGKTKIEQADLKKGTAVLATGSINQDGTFSLRSVQISN